MYSAVLLWGLLEDSNEQVDQKDVGYQEVAGHEGRCKPGAWDARRELPPVFIIQVITTGCCWRKSAGVDEEELVFVNVT